MNLRQQIGHGLKLVDVYEFRTHMSCTENYVDAGYGMYGAVLTALHEMGSWEDIVQSGQAHAGGVSVGLFFSRAADVWADTLDTGACVGRACAATVNPGVGGRGQPRSAFSAHKKALYILWRHLGLAVDVIIEDDLADGTLSDYAILALTDRHVSRNASRDITSWVGSGGVLLATAGAGALTEFDEVNTAMADLLGVNETALDAGDPMMPIAFLKQGERRRFLDPGQRYLAHQKLCVGL